jgi:hypothetical protein
MTWGSWPLVRRDELLVCRLNPVRFRLDRGTFAADSKSNRRLGGKPIHFSVVLAFAAVFGPSRSVNASLVRQRRAWSSDRAWPVRVRWLERPNTSGWTDAPPTFDCSEGFGLDRGRVQRG